MASLLGSFVFLSFTNSIACMTPKPRTSPTTLYFSLNPESLDCSAFARWVTFCSRLPSSKIWNTSRAAAQLSGFPPKVPPNPPSIAASMISALPVTPASTTPPPRPFADMVRSGGTPKVFIANRFPVRPKPDWISSAIKTISFVVQNSRSFCKNKAGD